MKKCGIQWIYVFLKEALFSLYNVLLFTVYACDIYYNSINTLR